MSTTEGPSAARRGSGSNDLLGLAGQESGGMRTTEAMATDRYQVVRGALWWRVKVGDGQQTVGRCYTQAGAERLAAALRTAFLDGAFVVDEMTGRKPAVRVHTNKT